MDLVDKDDLPEYYEVWTAGKVSLKDVGTKHDTSFYIFRLFRIQSVLTGFSRILRPTDSRTHKPFTKT